MSNSFFCVAFFFALFVVVKKAFDIENAKWLPEVQPQRGNYFVFEKSAKAVIPDCIAKGTTPKLGYDLLKGLLAIPALTTAAMGEV